MDEKYKINSHSELLDKNKVIRLFSYLLSVLLGMCFINCSNYETSKMEETWRDFRALHPYSYQTVALKHYGDTCVFVMSEPDSWVKETDLEKLFDKYDGQLIIRYQPYGYDGQLTDAVGCALLDSIKFNDFEKELFTLLYKTDYKPYYTDLDHPIKHIYYSKDYNLNYTTSPFIIESDLNEVFIVPSKGGTYSEKTVAELLESDMGSSNEIFFSKDRGFVIWVLNTDTIIQTDLFLQNARRFSLDTDLILGSIPQRDSINKLAIVAREREVPINILPPLRSETILQLVSNNDKLDLSFDSYNKSINDSTLATHISMTYWLENTELGNLMIMTDVLLKSWSENCEVRDYFLDYPIPDSYPFSKGVSNELGYIPHYLWNFYFDGESGCMPLEFNPPQETMVTGEEREIAFKTRMHFANLNCVDLVRATQYAAIYQLFKGLNVNYSIQNDSWICTPTWTVSNKIWGIGGYASQKGLTKAIKTAVKGPKIPHVPIRPIGPPRPTDYHIINRALTNYSDLSYVLKKNPEVSPLLLQYPNLAIVLRERPHLANLIPDYPYLPHALAKYPKIINELDKYPSLSNSLAEYPKLANILEKKPELSKTLSDNPELVAVLVNVPLTADLLLESPELANTLLDYPEVAEVIVRHRELSKVLSKYPVLADALTSTPQLADALVKYPSLAEEMAKFPNIADISTRNPHFLDLLSRRGRGSIRESLNITSSTDVQRGLDNRFHNVPVSDEDVLSHIQIQKVRDVSAQRINKMIEMRLQIKQELIKNGIHTREVLWEKKNTLWTFIIIDQYDKELNQAA